MTALGVPLGISQDYDQLPLAGALRTVVCQACRCIYEDGERVAADGCRVMAVLCWVCRQEARTRWIAERCTTVSLPRAIARYRRRLTTSSAENINEAAMLRGTEAP